MEQQYPRPARVVRRAALALALAVIVTALPAAAPAAWAQDDRAVIGPNHQRLGTAPPPDGIDVTWRAGGAAHTQQAPDRLGGGPQAVPDGGSARMPGAVRAAPPGARGSAATGPTGDLLADHGCAQKGESAALPHGQNCIDAARIYADGTVYVHAQVPAVLHVSINDEPAVGGTGEGDVAPVFGSFEGYDSDQSSAFVHELRTTPFELVQGTTYYISATATDGEGNVSWRYGEVLIPERVAHVVFERIHVLSDADTDKAGVRNRGEIEFDFSVDGIEYHHRPEDKIASGDWVELDPANRSVGFGVRLEGTPRLAELGVSGTEDDPGQCVIEAGGPPWISGGCDHAQARASIDLDDVFTGEPALPGGQNRFVLDTGDHHLEFRVYGHWRTEWI